MRLLPAAFLRPWHRLLCLLAAAGALHAAALAQDAPAAPQKVLRYAIRVAETGFDPVQVSDLYSRTFCAGIFDAPLRFAYLERPFKLVPNTLVDLPTVSADYKTLTFRVRPGIYFAPDAAFKGQKRELVAADYVYTLKRHYDPASKSPNLYRLEKVGLLGLSELRAKALKRGQGFDYDTPVPGARVLDRYTFELRLAIPDPRFVYEFTDIMMAAMAREVVEHYGDKIMAHPVGTGAWQLAQWRRSSRVVLEKNPHFRDEVYAEQPPANARPELRAQAAALQGRKLPLIDRVEVSIIEENQPRWLSFLRRESDFLEELPPEFIPIATPNNQLAPNLAKDGLQMVRYPRADVHFTYFNMEDPVVGGYTPERVALRRAISLAWDMDREVRLARRGAAIVSQGPVPPGSTGYDAALKTEMSTFSLARAKALLDLHGYRDANRDGWREQPDGSPLLLEYTTEPDGEKRQFAELFQKSMTALGLRVKVLVGKWPENLKAANAGKLQMWMVGWSAGKPDADDMLVLYYGPNSGQSNKARFRLAAFDRLYEQQRSLPDGPERDAVIRELTRLAVAYMPYKLQVHRIYTDLAQPWLLGYDRNIFMRDFWKYVDIDTARLQPAGS